MVKKRIISNQEYEKAWTDNDNQMIMKSVCCRFSKSLDRDELQQCKLTALWNSLVLWKPDFGKKFTSFLFQKLYWECLKAFNSKTRKKSSYIRHDPIDPYKNCDVYQIIDGISPDLQDILIKRFFYNMTLREISKEHNCCHETVRNKIKLAIEQLKSNDLK